MSSWNDVYSGLRQNLITALNGLVVADNITIGFPSSVVAMNSGQVDVTPPSSSFSTELSPLVMIYDRGYSRDATRWIPRYISDWVINASGVTFSIGAITINPGGVGNISILNGANINDSVGVWITNNMALGFTTVFPSASTPAQVATQVSLGIAGAFPSVLSASASAGVIQFTNSSASPVQINIDTANMGTAMFEVRRVKRSGHIIVMANSPLVLDTVGEPVSQMLGQMEIYYGYELPDGTYVRVINTADACFWENVQNNIARRDWLLELEYGVTMLDNGYPVLATILQTVYS